MPLRNNTVTPITAGFTSFYTGNAGNVLNVSSGFNRAPVAGSIYWAALMIPYNTLITGLCFSAGTVGGTDNWISAFYDSSGTLLAKSASTAAPASANKKLFPFAGGPITVNGPSIYYAAVQSNGTTATILTFGISVETFGTGSQTGVFDTLASITPSSTYTNNVGPFASTY
jgi:hypothetical protein